MSRKTKDVTSTSTWAWTMSRKTKDVTSTSHLVPLLLITPSGPYKCRWLIVKILLIQYKITYAYFGLVGVRLN
jgi:hypothetical protein